MDKKNSILNDLLESKKDSQDISTPKKISFIKKLMYVLFGK